MKICSTALDVVAVSDIHGNIYSTKFHVQFQETILDYTALSLLGIHTRRNHPNQSKTFTSEQQDKITNSNSSNNLHSNTDNDDSVNDISKQAKLDRQFLLQQNQIEPEWCSIFCNNQKCPEILAFIGVDDLLVFIDKNEINEYEECEQLKANEIFIPTEINDTTSPLRQQQYQRKAYDFTYTPSSKILEYLHLNKGCNKIICKNRLSGVIAEFNVFLYEYTDKLVIMDIDGTVTKSDVRGYFESVYLGIYNHTHHGVVEFLNNLKSSCNCDILYLTSRPISHLKETKLLLRNTRDKKNSDKNKSNCLPLGPVFANTETLITAAYREIIAKNTVSLKSSILDTISDVFKQAALASVFPGFTGDPASVLPGFTGDPDYRTDFYFNPFLFGIGNKNADAVAYKRAGVTDGHILIISTKSVIKVWIDTKGIKNKNHENERNSNIEGFISSENNVISTNREHKSLEFITYSDVKLIQYLEQIVI